jgi:hypothetical protein
MNQLKAFIAGMIVPSIVLPFFLCLGMALGRPQILDIVFVHFIPLIWGVWNILYFAFFKRFFPSNINLRLLLTGGLLGLFIAIFGVFGLHLPSILQFPRSLTYFPLLFVPILYAVLWWLFVGPLNSLFNLKDR